MFVIGVVLTGCGGAGDDTSPDTNNDTAQDPVPESPNEPNRAPDAEHNPASDDVPQATDQTPTDIRDIDWAALTWRTSCDTEGTFSVELERDAREEPGAGRHTALIPTDGVDSYSYSVDLERVVYADVTGDGQDEAAFLAFCIPGNYAVETRFGPDLDSAPVDNLRPNAKRAPRWV